MILVLLVWVQSNNRMDSFELVQPTIVKALFIDENPQVRNQQILERQRVERIEQQRILREEEQFREQEEVERQQRQVQEQREREQTVLRNQEELERQRAQEAQQERERQERTRVEQQRELVEAERLRQEEEVERQRQAEEVAVIAAEAARTEFELVQSATALIQQALQQVWNRPPSARNGMRAILRIRMLPTGELIEASITQSSGDSAFDRSAENAVYSASPFAELQNLPINVFNTNFRTLTLIFEPEDLLN
jgi:colicin import membrane protein